MNENLFFRLRDSIFCVHQLIGSLRSLFACQQSEKIGARVVPRRQLSLDRSAIDAHVPRPPTNSSLRLNASISSGRMRTGRPVTRTPIGTDTTTGHNPPDVGFPTLSKAEELDALNRTGAVVQDEKRRRIKVHFFFQVGQVWTTWETVWKACVQKQETDTTVVLLPFLHGAANDPQKARQFLEEHNIPFVDLSAYDLRTKKPDVVFLQNPYDSTRPSEITTENLVAAGVRVAYIPYGLDVGGGQDNLRWQYDLNVQRLAWRIFVRSEQHKQMYGVHCAAGNNHVIVTGHPKIDRIVASYKSVGFSGTKSPDAVRTVLWSPHFSVEHGGWSTFPALSNSILSYFEARPLNCRLIVRPHPLFFGRLREIKGADSLEERGLRARLNQPPYINLDDNDQYEVSFQTSDALITDAGSFLLEYLPTGKPILYLHNPNGPGLNESGSFVEFYYQAINFPEVEAFLTMVQHGNDPTREQRVKLMDTLLHRTDGNVGMSIADYVVSEFWKAQKP